MKAYNQLTIDDKNAIVESYFKDKVEFKEIPKKLDVSERAVSRVLKERGINTRRKNRYTLNESYFERIDDEKKAYILGLLYADGFVGDEKFNNIVISLTESDKSMLEDIVSAIEFTGNIRYNEKLGNFEGSKGGYVLNFSSAQMANDLRKLGLHPGKSLTMTNMPELDIKLIRHFIRGYFDGDGSITLSTSTSHYKMKDGMLKIYKYPNPIFTICGTSEFLKSIGQYIPTKFFIVDSKTPQIKYLKTYTKADIHNIYLYLYHDSTIYLERKFNKWQEVISALDE